MGDKKNIKLRLLLIYDFSSQPFSVGDILIFQEASLVLRELHDLGTVDIALVYDPTRPVVSDPAFEHVRPESFLFHLSSILPAAQVNPYLGTLLLFDSPSKLEKYVADNIDSYYVWPSFADYASHKYLYYHCFNKLFVDCFTRKGVLPSLCSRPAVNSWAREFLEKHAHRKIPVSVQLRRNPSNPARNSDYGSWIDFFRYCANHYPVQFIVICSPGEIDPVLRQLGNVVVAKDSHTSLEQDLALIEASSMHMGASSGPGTIAIFNSKPYCMFGFDANALLSKVLITEEHRVRFFFAKKEQYWVRQAETYELLVREFKFLWAIHNSSYAF